MKTTKHIEKLAQQMADNDDYRTKESYAHELENLRQALIKGFYYTRVETVAKSGLSRTIAIGYIKDNKLHHIHNGQILALAGCDNDGRIAGGGMDMLFGAQYNLFVSLAPNLDYREKMARYNYM